MATSQNLVTALFEVAEEKISRGYIDMLPGIDKFFNEIISDWEGVESDLSKPGRNASGSVSLSTWAKTWIMKAGGGGMSNWTNPAPSLVTNFDNTSPTPDLISNVGVYAANSGFPAVTEFVFSRFHNARIGLCENRGLLAMPWQLEIANKLPSTLIDVIADQAKDAAKNHSMLQAVCMFSRNPNWGECLRSSLHTPTGSTNPHPYVRLADLAGNADNSRVTISRLWEEDHISKVQPGLSVDIFEMWWDDSATIKVRALSANGFIVEATDVVNQRVQFVEKTGANISANAPTASGLATADRITYVVTLRNTLQPGGSVSTSEVTFGNTTTPADTSDAGYMNDIDLAVNTAATTGVVGGSSKAYGCDGLMSWVKGLTTTPYTETLYGVAVGNVPTLVSYCPPALGDYLSERKFNDYVSWSRSQLTPEGEPDTMITTPGVLNGFVANLTGSGASGGVDYVRFDYDRTGKQVKIASGWSGITFNYRGREYKLYDSPLFRRKSLHMLRLGAPGVENNLVRLVPPPIPGANNDMRFRDVQFVAKWYGASGNFLPAVNTSTGMPTDFRVAPYVGYVQHMLKKPAGVFVTGILESTGT